MTARHRPLANYSDASVSEPTMVPIEVMVEEQPELGNSWRVVWCNRDPDILIGNIPECWMDLIPFMVARQLLFQGYDLDQLLIVRLQIHRQVSRTLPSGA
jgi:hypothetical protein